MVRFCVPALVLAVCSGATAASTHYVSMSGKDTNAGTQGSPWRTIQHACNSISAGDTVVVLGGVYHERVTLVRPMALESAPGTRAAIDGTGVAIPATDSGLVTIRDVGHVTVSGFEIRNYKTSDSSLAPAGILVAGMEDSVMLRGNLIDHIETDGSNSSSINAFGIQVYGDSAKGAITHLNIIGNEVRDTKTGNSETVSLNGNVNGFLVSGNVVHDVNNIGIDCIGFEGVSPIGSQDQARNGEVSGNVVYNVSSLNNPAYQSAGADGIYVDGGADILIERNIVRRADIGLEVTSEHLGRVASGVTARSNLLFECTVTGLSIGGYASNRGGTKDCLFVNNTLYGNDTSNSGSGEMMIQFHTGGNVFKNNVLSATSQGVLISEPDGAGTPGVISDYNLYFAPANPTWIWGANDFSDLASFVSGTGQDRHSLFGNPKFVGPSHDNLHLLAGSPAILKGANLGSSVVGSFDLDGRPRLTGSKINIGCYE